MKVPSAWSGVFDEGEADMALMREFRAELAPFLERLNTVYLPAVLRLTDRGAQSAEWLRDKLTDGHSVDAVAHRSDELLTALDEVLGLVAPPAEEVRP